MRTPKHYAYVMRISSPSHDLDITGDAYDALDEGHVLLSAVDKIASETGQKIYEIKVLDFSCFETTS